MRKTLIILSLLIALSLIADVPQIYSQIRVPWEYKSRVNSEIVYARVGVWAEYALDQYQMDELDMEGIPYETRIPDMTDYYQSRMEPSMDMGGWRTYDMIYAALESLHTEYPDFVSEPESIGVGWDGHVQWVVKISDNVNVDEDEPEVLIAGGIHAREVIAPEVVLSFAEWLVESYELNEISTHLVNHREIWVFPLINPDGYYYNQLIEPSGGGMWRKNRRDNGDGTHGVDLNRNFPYMWGYDDTGSSPFTDEETYRGPSAGNEPETQTTMAFINSREFRTSLSFHSYSNLYLFTWGYTVDPCPDHDWMMRIGYRYARHNGYVYGPGATAIYPTNGDTDDWIYGDTSGHPFCIPCTPEVGGYYDGFWPSLSRKPVLVEENMNVCIVNSQIAGSAPFFVNSWIDDFVIGDSSGHGDPGENFLIKLQLENLGFDPSMAYVIASSPMSGVSILTDTAWVSAAMLSQAYDTVAIEINLDETRFESGDLVKLYFEIRDTSGHLTDDSTTFICGTPVMVDYWDFESAAGEFTATGDWQWGEPGAGPDAAFSGTNLWATRLNSNYNDDTESALISASVTIPAGSYRPRLSFMHWYAFEPPSGGDVYDGGTVKISTNGGISWTVINPISGYDGVAYSSNPHVGGDSVFTGMGTNWQEESFDLSAYEGMNVMFEFVAGSDPYVNDFGWYLDDVSILYYVETGFSAEEKLNLPSKVEITSYPNPFNAACKITVNSENEIRGLEIFDIDGKKVKTLKSSFGNSSDKSVFLWNGKGNNSEELSTGVYFVKILGVNSHVNKKILLIK